ncbi:MAG: SDR family oxidoreductase [Betaproteobacteria bacterium]|nr:SDR family oxidoreductase [Betaproteobacteria bacterium]
MNKDSGAGRLADRVALVTGSATGIGEAIARLFVAEGATVVAAGLQDDRLSQLAGNYGIHPAHCDVTAEREVREVVATTVAQWGGLHVVVNAAGILMPDNVGDIQDECWSRMLDVNLTGAMRVCRAAIGAMESAGGSIVNIASVAAFNASAGMASYAASKAGVVALTRAIANAYGPNGIRANCLCPGWTRTPMSELEMEDNARVNGTSVDAEFAKLTERIALRRVASPDEIARCALFLASDEASFVTGAVLVADGGARSPAAAKGF